MGKHEGIEVKKIAKRLIFCIITSGLAIAQTGQHSVTLNWVDTLNPAGTTYNVYRAAGPCSGSTTFTTPINTGVLVKTYQDLTVTTGKYCYAVTAVLNGVESTPINAASTSTSVPAFSPSSLTATPQ